MARKYFKSKAEAKQALCDRADNTYSAVNEYLDTWCGSVDEEAAFIKAGVEPY